MKEKKVIGLRQTITIHGKKKNTRCTARIDTGAIKSSIDIGLANEIGLGPVIRTKLIKSANGSSLRPIVKGEITLSRKKIMCTFTLADRSHMKYKVLLGQNVLVGNNFLIDPDQHNDISN